MSMTCSVLASHHFESHENHASNEGNYHTLRLFIVASHFSLETANRFVVVLESEFLMLA